MCSFIKFKMLPIKITGFLLICIKTLKKYSLKQNSIAVDFAAK